MCKILSPVSLDSKNLAPSGRNTARRLFHNPKVALCLALLGVTRTQILSPSWSIAGDYRPCRNKACLARYSVTVTSSAPDSPKVPRGRTRNNGKHWHHSWYAPDGSVAPKLSHDGVVCLRSNRIRHNSGRQTSQTVRPVSKCHGKSDQGVDRTIMTDEGKRLKSRQ